MSPGAIMFIEVIKAIGVVVAVLTALAAPIVAGVRLSVVLGQLAEAIKELKTVIVTLTDRVAALETKVAVIEALQDA